MKFSFIVAILFSLNALAWGPTGHRVVGEIAEKNLDPKVKAKITEILGGQSLARVANWPDEIRSEPQTYSYTYPWHFTDWGDDVHQHDETNSSGKLLGSINEQLAVLKDPKATPEKKTFALKFVIHLVGDLHQPLHVGNGLDNGGNNCKVYFHNKLMNLHALWDEEMINFSQLSFTEMAQFVSQGKNGEDFKSGTIVDWAEESKQLRLTIYPNEITPARMSVKQYCRKDITVANEELPKLAFEYSYKFLPIAEKRLFQAGIRLASLLNGAMN